MSVWVSLHQAGTPHGWGGFDVLRPAELAELLGLRPFVLLLGGASADVRYLLDKHGSQLAGRYHCIRRCRRP